MSYEYELNFKAKMIGALGIASDVKITMTSSAPLSTEEIEKIIYQTYEHVSQLKIDEIKKVQFKARCPNG